jgi:hypothetical protein
MNKIERTMRQIWEEKVGKLKKELMATKNELARKAGEEQVCAPAPGRERNGASSSADQQGSAQKGEWLCAGAVILSVLLGFILGRALNKYL